MFSNEMNSFLEIIDWNSLVISESETFDSKIVRGKPFVFIYVIIILKKHSLIVSTLLIRYIIIDKLHTY